METNGGLTQEQQNMVQALSPADALKAYAGRPGCMCGCLGRYWVTADARTEAGEDRGYPYDDGDVDDAKVLQILRKVQAQAAVGAIKIGDKFHYIYAEIGKKCYAVYLRDAARGAK